MCGEIPQTQPTVINNVLALPLTFDSVDVLAKFGLESYVRIG